MSGCTYPNCLCFDADELPELDDDDKPRICPEDKSKFPPPGVPMHEVIIPVGH